MSLFEPGDRVRATEGGPILLVKGYQQAGQVVCCWYETKQGWKQECHPERSLKRVGRVRRTRRSDAM